MSFHKILIANGGDSRRIAPAAAKAHVGPADVSRSQTAWHAQRAAIEPRYHV
ncbi:MAG: hypothetical protein LCI02_25865 [Proteobacteria bacterium]|nr:hypothetical protein [Pseudomonadota bacterium]